jgi:hypothetical protein
VRENGWLKGGSGTLTFSQVALKNWAAGGQDSYSATTLINLFAFYKKDSLSWDSNLDLGYGIMKQGSTNFIKTDDRIDLSSKFGKKAVNNFYYAAIFNFRTQMQPGFKQQDNTEKISDFFAPAYFIEAIGMDYKPSDFFTLFFAPLTGKTTIVLDQSLADAGAFGVTKAQYDANGKIISHGKNMRNEFGGFIKMMFQKNIVKNVSLRTKLDLFSNYLKNPENIDVNWEVLIDMKINKHLSASFYTTLIYDDDVKIPIDKNGDGVADYSGPRTQFKEVFGLGLSYKFQ